MTSPPPSDSDVHWITKVREPRRLVVVWQPADGSGDRRRRAIAEVVKEGENVRFSYLRGTPDYEEAFQQGFLGYPAFRLAQVDHTQGVMAALLRRLPPRSRQDFPVYLAALRIPVSLPISDFALLGVSEAKLPGDGFSLVDPLEDLRAPADLMMEIAGYRHNAPSLTDLDIGKPVLFIPEPTNAFDPHAIKIMLGEKKLGYINTVQARAFGEILHDCRVSAVIERLNGKPDKPRAFIFAEIACGDR